MKEIFFKGFKLTLGSFKDVVEQVVSLAHEKTPSYVCFANVHMFVESSRNIFLQQAISGADIVTTDGVPLTWMLKTVLGIHQERISGMDMLPTILKIAELENISVFFCGSTANTLERTGEWIRKEYPKLKIAGFYSPPFTDNITNLDHDMMTYQINRHLPCVVIVVLGCPKQEIFMHTVFPKINAVMLGLGGALPVLLGEIKRAPRWMQNLGLEWLHRLMQEPRRLLKRYVKTNTIFLIFFLKTLIQKTTRTFKAKHYSDVAH
jgi:N-acetylglucosaminyldiphosphoundecaprenol N-acetyl-beta-D-mannosaminyltransferase